LTISISSTPRTTIDTSTWQQKQQDVLKLSAALNSGNLSGARQIFAAWTSPPATNATIDNKTMLSSPMATLATALESGDIKAAQQAFAAIPAKHAAIAQATAYGAKNTSASAKQPQLVTSGSIGTRINTSA